MHEAYFDGHRAGSRHAWNSSGEEGEPPGWETDEEEAERNADPTIDEDLQKWTGEGTYARLAGKLEEMEGELVREALTAWSGFVGFCEQELGLTNYLKRDRRCWRLYHSKMQATLISPR